MIPKILSPLFRQRKGNKLYIVINLLGLSIAITVAILIYGLVIQEVKTDSFHKNGKNIYRVLNREDRTTTYTAAMCGPLAPAIQNQVSGVEAFVRLWLENLKLRTEIKEENEISRRGIFADSSFFNFFTFPLIKGVVNTKSPYSWAVISEKMAKQLFGSQDPVGKNIHVTAWSKSSVTYEIVAVMKNIPAWSTIQTDIVLDYRTMEKRTDWYNNYQTMSYLQLNPNSSIKDIEKQIWQIYVKNTDNVKDEIKLQPLGNIYYDKEQVQYSYSYPLPKGSITFTWLLIGITLLILFLSFGNYLMIKIAEGVYRMKVFSIQRCFGANSFIVWKYFLKETTFYFIIAGMIAVVLAWGLFPFFLRITSPQFYYPYPVTVKSIIGFILLLGIFITLISGILSYYYLRKIYTKGIKNNIEKKNSVFDIRKVLATISIAIFCLLSINTAIVYKQFNFVTHKELGYNNKNTIALYATSEAMRDQLLSCPDILSVACGGSSLPKTYNEFWKLTYFFGESKEMEIKTDILSGDANYLNTYQIDLLEGENFDPDTEPVAEGIIPILVNQEFVKQTQLKHAVGTIFKVKEDDEPSSFKIIGVVKDFHVRLLYNHIEPTFIVYSKGPSTGYFNNSITILRYQPEKRAEVGKFLNENNFYFDDPQYASFYEKEKAFIHLINIAALLAIFIGGLGIFAFSVFFANSRKKEVALRKINGGTEWDIQKLFNREFIRLTLYACIVSIPLAFYFIHFWLEKFAYQTAIEWYFFLFAILVCLGFVILIITWQIRKIANINPVECLKDL